MTSLEIVATGEIVEPMNAEEASSVTTQIKIKLDVMADNYESVQPLIREALTRQAYAALGYKAPGDYIADRFGGALARLDVDVRRAFVKEMSAAGMSTRQIAPVLGVSKSQVAVDREVSSTGRLATCPDCGNRLDHGETCEGCYPAYSDMARIVDDLEDDDDPALTEEECRALADPDDLDDEPEPEPAPRVIGSDGKSYPATKPRKANRRAITDAFWTATYDLGKKVTTLTNLAGDDRFTKNADQLREKNLSDLIRARDALQCVIDQLAA